jgi:uncharacterized protein (TIGR02270 family)
MAAPSTRAVPWDIFEEHLNEAAFLWGQWEDALVAANYNLGDVIAGPESRLLAHLDALVLGGQPVADRLLLPALADDEPERIAAAAWALVQAEKDDHQDAIIAAMVQSKPPVRAAIVRALGLSPRADLSRLARLWPTGAPEIRGAIFDLMRVGEPTSTWVHENLEPVLRGGDSIPLAGALRALRQAPNRALLDCVDAALKTELREVRREAITTGIVLDSKAAWDACRRAAIKAGDACRLPLALLASSNRAADRAVVHAFARDPKVKRHAVWALGFAGDLEAANVLVEATADKAVAKIAGEALWAITGVTLEGPLVVRGETQGPSVKEVSDDDPPPIVRTEDHLPLPNAAAVKTWWQGARTRFSPGVRHIFGQPRTPDALRAALAVAPMWRREVLWVELAAAVGGAAPAINLQGWAHEQTATRAPAPARGAKIENVARVATPGRTR